MIVKKEKEERRDFGNTITPKTATLMLSGLTGYIAQTADYMIVCSPDGFSDFHIEPEIFNAKQKRTSRYNPTDIALVRDCLILMNGNMPPAKNTAVSTCDLDLFHRIFVGRKPDSSKLAATVAKVGPFLARHGYWVEAYMGGVRIVKNRCFDMIHGGGTR